MENTAASSTSFNASSKKINVWRTDVIDYIMQLYDDESTSDIILRSGNTNLSAHRCILSSISYFKAMLQSDMKESKTGIIDLTKTIPEEHLKAFVKYIYGGALSITSENAVAWLNISQQLLLEDITSTVSNVLENNIEKESCVTILKAMYPFLNLCTLETFQMAYKRTAQCFASNLKDIMKTEEYHKLPWKQVETLLSLNEHINEQNVFEAAMEWMQVDSNARDENLFHCLFEVVRLPQLPPWYLTNNVMTHPILMQSKDKNKLFNLISEAIMYQTQEKEPSGNIRYEKRTGYLQEAYKVWDENGQKIDGVFRIEENRDGSELLYAQNPKGDIILQERRHGSNREFWLGHIIIPRYYYCKRASPNIHVDSRGNLWYDHQNILCRRIRVERVKLDCKGNETLSDL